MTEPAGTMNAGRRRVLHVIDSLGLGGAQAILKTYLEARPDDRAVHLIALRDTTKRVEISHPNVFVIASHSRFSMAPLAKMREIVRDARIEVLHCHLFRAQVFGYILKATSFPRLVLVFHEHGRVVGREGESWLESLVFRVFLRATRRRVDRYICNSDHARMKLHDVLGKSDCHATTVANPVCAQTGSPTRMDIDSWRNEVGVPAGAFVVGFAARFTEAKGWRDFLLSMQQLVGRLPVFFLLAGEGEERGEVESSIRELGLQAHGRVLGYVNSMERFYPMLDVFALPSHWESHGMSHLEAQSHAIPVVISDVPGLNSTVHAESDALLFQSGNPSALAGQIHRIASDPVLRASLVRQGLANAAHYNVDTFASRLDELYAATLAVDATEQNDK